MRRQNLAPAAKANTAHGTSIQRWLVAMLTTCCLVPASWCPAACGCRRGGRWHSCRSSGSQRSGQGVVGASSGLRCWWNGRDADDGVPGCLAPPGLLAPLDLTPSPRLVQAHLSACDDRCSLCRACRGVGLPRCGCSAPIPLWCRLHHLSALPL